MSWLRDRAIRKTTVKAMKSILIEAELIRLKNQKMEVCDIFVLMAPKRGMRKEQIEDTKRKNDINYFFATLVLLSVQMELVYDPTIFDGDAAQVILDTFSENIKNIESWELKFKNVL